MHNSAATDDTMAVPHSQGGHVSAWLPGEWADPPARVALVVTASPVDHAGQCVVGLTVDDARRLGLRLLALVDEAEEIDGRLSWLRTGGERS